MTESQDLISAIEAYLTKNGKGSSYLVKKITALFENADSPLNLKSGPLKNLKDSIKTFNKNITSVSKNVSKLSDKLKLVASEIKVSKFAQLSNASDKFSDAIKSFSKNIKSIKPQKSSSLPNTTGFTRELTHVTKRLKDFRSKFKVTLLQSFFDNLRTLNTSLKKANKTFGTSGVESSVSSKSVHDVRVVDVSSSIKALLTKNNKPNVTNNVVSTTSGSDSGGSWIGTLIKGLLGGTALLAGVGFVSKYFQNNPAAKAMFSTLTENAFNSLTKLKNEISKIFSPIIKTIGEYAWEGAKLSLKQIPKLFSTTFNFFGLKESLGEENEGLAVIITKGIYASIKKLLTGFLNKSTFGLFGSGLNLILPQLEKLGASFMQDGIFGTLKKVLSKIFSPIGNLLSPILKPLGNMGEKLVGSVSNMLKPISGLFNGIGSVGKAIGKIGNTFSKILGTAFSKLLGGGLKVIGKRIPLVGTLISFVDAYDRFKKGDILGGFISVGSGIATIFPGIGTAISIGLDVLNAILDSKSASEGKSKGRMLLDFAGPMIEKITDGVGGFLKSIWDMISGILEAAKNFVTDKAKGISDYVSGGVDSFAESLGFSADRKSSSKDQDEINALRKRSSEIRAKRASATHVQDGEIVIPDKKDAHIFAKEDGPFNKNLKEMNNKMSALINVFAEGVQLIANTTNQGSSSIVQAVVATGSKSSSSTIAAGSIDPIGEYRLRAARAIEYVSR